LCDYNITINFGVVAREVILVDSCDVIVIYLVQKKIEKKFKLNFLVELGFDI
jgi:hypothetical protein